MLKASNKKIIILLIILAIMVFAIFYVYFMPNNLRTVKGLFSCKTFELEVSTRYKKSLGNNGGFGSSNLYRCSDNYLKLTSPIGDEGSDSNFFDDQNNLIGTWITNAWTDQFNGGSKPCKLFDGSDCPECSNEPVCTYQEE